MEKGLQEGRKEGNNRLKEAAKNLKVHGISTEIIAQSTGLSIEEIARL